jgi:hypothetical protein
MFVARYMPCPDCGASVERTERANHVCDPERWLDYQLFQRRDELSAFEGQLRAYLETLRGRFDVWYAEQRRRQD